MKLVRSGAGNDIDHPSAAPAEFSAVAVGLIAELLDCIGIRHYIRYFGVGILVNAAIERERGRVTPASADRNQLGGGFRPGGRLVERRRGRVQCSRSYSQELQNIPAVQRQVRN